MAFLFFSHSSYAKNVKRKSEQVKQSKNNYHLILAPYQLGNRYVKMLDTQMQWQQQVVHSLGFRWNNHQLLVDYMNSTDDSGNQTLIFKKEHHEILLNYQYLLYPFNEYLTLGFGLGLGVYEDSLKSRLLSQEITERTGNQLLSTGSVLLSGNWNVLYYGIDLQAIVGRDYDPQPTLSYLIRFGLQFAIF